MVFSTAQWKHILEKMLTTSITEPYWKLTLVFDSILSLLPFSSILVNPNYLRSHRIPLVFGLVSLQNVNTKQKVYFLEIESSSDLYFTVPACILRTIRFKGSNPSVSIQLKFAKTHPVLTER